MTLFNIHVRNSNIKMIDGLRFEYEEDFSYFNDLISIYEIRTLPKGLYIEIYEEKRRQNITGDCSLCEFIFDYDNDNETGMCNCCIDHVNNIKNDTPIGYINMKACGLTHKMPIYGFMNDVLITDEGRCITLWKLEIGGMGEFNIYDCIYSTFSYYDIHELEPNKNGIIEELVCDYCQEKITFHYHHINDKIRCSNCLSYFDMFEEKLDLIYLTFSYLLLPEISKIIVNDVIYFYSYIKSLSMD